MQHKIESYEVLSEHPHMPIPTALALHLENGSNFMMGSIPAYIGTELMRIQHGISKKNEFFLIRELKMHNELGNKIEINIKADKGKVPLSIFRKNEKILGKEPRIMSLGRVDFSKSRVKAGPIKTELSGLSGVMAAIILSAKLKFQGKSVKNIKILAKGNVPIIALDVGKYTPAFVGVDPHQIIFLSGFNYAKQEYKPIAADRHTIESFIYLMKKSKVKLKEIRISGITAHGTYVAEAVLENSMSVPIIPSNAILLKEIFSIPGYVDDTLVKIQEKTR
jgi:bifunctional DNase/RNase